MTPEEKIAALEQKARTLEAELLALRKIRRAAFALRFDPTPRKGEDLDALLNEYLTEWERKHGKY